MSASGDLAALGLETERVEMLSPEPSERLAALLDLEDVGALPPLWHWLHFLPNARQSMIGDDGHPRRTGALDDPMFRRRMFAGGRLTIRRALVTGVRATRRASIASVTEKVGKQGTLLFVTVRHELRQRGVICITEEQDIVYRSFGPPQDAPIGAVVPDRPAEGFVTRITPDPVLLARFSAVTYNGHRIHYDREYAVDVEGYPGLVVHGPLTAIMLATAAQQHHGSPLRSFAFRATAPLFDLAAFHLVGDAAATALTAVRNDGAIAMEATAEF